jgi:hypothetical protein
VGAVRVAVVGAWTGGTTATAVGGLAAVAVAVIGLAATAAAVAVGGLAAAGAAELLVVATGLAMAAVPPPTVGAVVGAGADAGGKDSGVLRATPVQPIVPDDAAAAVATVADGAVVGLFPVDANAT